MNDISGIFNQDVDLFFKSLLIKGVDIIKAGPKKTGICNNALEYTVSKTALVAAFFDFKFSPKTSLSRKTSIPE